MDSTVLSPDNLLRNLSDFRDARHWYVGFSGGVDSTVLLHLLAALRETHPDLPPLTAVHVDHGLQAESGNWRTHCQRVCQEWDVPLVTREVDTAAFGSGELGAREARYSVFHELLGEGDVLLLAHHLDDQVETFFLRLLRGAGVRGLAAMPASRPIGAGRLARPLLGFLREDVERCAAANGLAFVEDPSNADTGFDRNYLRAEVLPLLAARWPGYRGAVARATGHMAATSDLLRESLAIPVEVSSSLGDPGLALADLFARGEEAAALMLRDWLDGYGLPAPDRAPLMEFLRQLADAPDDAQPQLALADYALQRYRDAVFLLPHLPVPQAPMALPPGEELFVPGIGVLRLVEVQADGFVLAPGDKPQVTWRAGGERVQLLGRSHSSSLKQLLQERAVPPWWRSNIPLLAVGEEVLCVGDLARCESPRWRALGGPDDTLWQFTWGRDVIGAGGGSVP
ncbi:MAG: tRNA lysidine(34) synthetase TilS [Halioglobus sp.]